MVISMFLAHLIGDYILQWDALALWKSRALKGVLLHGMIVLLVTWVLILPFDPAWWPWALLIGLTHTAVDAGWLLTRHLPERGRMSPPFRFVIDQSLHVIIIVVALTSSGYLPMPELPKVMLTEAQNYRWLAFLMGYVFISMPAWIVIEFAIYGLVRGSAPDFSPSAHKYVSILERGLITTLVVLGQFGLVPLVALPRLVFEKPQMIDSGRTRPYVAELLASIALAVAIGLGLRLL